MILYNFMISKFLRVGGLKFVNGDVLFRGVTELKTFEDMGEGSKTLEKVVTSFMDGPKGQESHYIQPIW